MASADGDVDAVDITFDFNGPCETSSNGQDMELTFDNEELGPEEKVECIASNGPNLTGAFGPEKSGHEIKKSESNSPKAATGLTLDLCPPTITIQEPSPMVERLSPDDVMSKYEPPVVSAEVSTTDDMEQITYDNAVEKQNDLDMKGEKMESKDTDECPNSPEENDFEYDESIITAGINTEPAVKEDDYEFDFDESIPDKNSTQSGEKPSSAMPSLILSSGGPSVSVHTTTYHSESTEKSLIERSANLGDVDFEFEMTPTKPVRTISGIQIQSSKVITTVIAEVKAADYSVTNEAGSHENEPNNIESENIAVASVPSTHDGTRPKQAITTTPPNGSIGNQVFADDKSNAVLAAEEEWNEVQEITPGLENEEGNQAKRGKRQADLGATPFLSYRELLEHYRSTDLNEYKSQIHVSVPRKGFAALTHALFGTKLNKSLHADRDLIFCLAACPFQNEEAKHSQTLQTIYRKLTGSKFDCPRFGGHWEQIGFQGNDPSTDLRGCGFLGLFQLIYLLSDAKTIPLAKDIYKLAQHETQNFPFCIMSINITRIAMQCLRGDVLNKECNKAKDLLNIFNDFYVGIYYRLYTMWKSGHKTIADTGYVMKDVEAICKKNPREILRGLEAYKARNQGGFGDAPLAGMGAPGSSNPSNDLHITKFSEMEEGQ